MNRSLILSLAAISVSAAVGTSAEAKPRLSVSNIFTPIVRMDCRVTQDLCDPATDPDECVGTTPQSVSGYLYTSGGAPLEQYPIGLSIDIYSFPNDAFANDFANVCRNVVQEYCADHPGIGTIKARPILESFYPDSTIYDEVTVNCNF